MQRTLQLNTLVLLLFFSLIGDISANTSTDQKCLATEMQHISEEERTFRKFSGLDIKGPFEVELFFGNENKIVIDGDKKQLRKTSSLLKGKELVIRYDAKASEAEKVYIQIYMTELKSLHIAGKTEISAEQTIIAKKVQLEIKENAVCYLAFQTDMLSVDMTGAAQCELEGNNKTLQLESTDASYFDAKLLTNTTVNIKASGASQTYVNAAKSLKIQAENVAQIRYSGKPNQTNFISKGSARIEATP